MTTTFTPGPWTYIDDGPLNFLINAIDSPVGETGREANARLIAAAPELLDALESLRAELRHAIRLDVKKHFSLMVADAAAGTAIVKAKGIEVPA